jgi:hypothetical protein
MSPFDFSAAPRNLNATLSRFKWNTWKAGAGRHPALSPSGATPAVIRFSYKFYLCVAGRGFRHNQSNHWIRVAARQLRSNKSLDLVKLDF